jgi:hypothetical protein
MDVGATYNGVKAYAKAVETAKSLDHAKVQTALGWVRLPENESWNSKGSRFGENQRVHISPTDGLIFYTYQFTEAGGVNIVAPAEYKTGEVLIPSWVLGTGNK